MAFEEFGQLSKRRRLERAEKKKRVIIALVATVVVLLCVAGGTFAFFHFRRNSTSQDSPTPIKGEVQSSSKIVDIVCSTATYKDKCKGALSKAIASHPEDVNPKTVIKTAISAAKDELHKVIKKVGAFKFDKPEEKSAYEVCKHQFDDAMDELSESISMTGADVNDKIESRIADLKTLLSAVMSYQETCIDAFPDGELKKKMKTAMNDTEEYVSNSLAIVTEIGKQGSDSDKSKGRRLLVERPNDGLSDWDVDDSGLPAWVGRQERKLLIKATANVKPNLTVAKDGSGDYKTINEALKSIPADRKDRLYILVKEGVYEENVNVSKKMVNITMYGEGSDKTIVTGNKNFVDGVPTYLTATFAAMGEGFIGIGMTFRNTAGPEKHQAVALRVQADRAIFLSCRMEGYQDTLYVQAHRQFYRSCNISGTVDFIFGDAAVILQNCTLFVRKPSNGQQNIVTAQGRVDKNENTGIVIHNSRIFADPAFEPEKAKFKTYLGRPWKQYSRTIVMQATIGDLINPAGWLPWAGDFALKTLQYAEYANRGPGSDTSKRVNWAGYKKSISKEEAQGFTIMPFLQGDWIKRPGVPVPFQEGLYNN